jgi:hypothetical protein
MIPPRPAEASVSPSLLEAVGRFEGVPLEETGWAALFDRTDTKYILPVERISEVLADCASRYRAVEVGGNRLCAYSTLYFDSEDLVFYRQHHDGRRHRQKVRIRTYEEPGTHFLEVKERNNHGRTMKSRVPVESRLVHELERLEDATFRGVSLPVARELLHPVLRVDYTRLTLVSRTDLTVGSPDVERVTVDLMLRYAAGEARLAFPGIAVVEVKQAHRGPTPLRQTLRTLRVPEGGISKYCLGVAKLRPDARSNRFRAAVRRVTEMGAA